MLWRLVRQRRLYLRKSIKVIKPVIIWRQMLIFSMNIFWIAEYLILNWLFRNIPLLIIDSFFLWIFWNQISFMHRRRIMLMLIKSVLIDNFIYDFFRRNFLRSLHLLIIFFLLIFCIVIFFFFFIISFFLVEG